MNVLDLFSRSGLAIVGPSGIVALASLDAAWITGEVVAVDGGLTIG